LFVFSLYFVEAVLLFGSAMLLFGRILLYGGEYAKVGMQEMTCSKKKKVYCCCPRFE